MLDSVSCEIGFPRTIRVHQGSEFVSRDLYLRRTATWGELDFSRHRFIEVFNELFRAECLSAHRSLSLADLREKVEVLRGYYEEPPHRAIGYKSQIALMNPDGAAGQPW